MAYELDQYTVSLLHFEDGIKDETGKVWNAQGNIGISDVQKQIGSKSLLCNNGILSYADTDKAFVFGTSDFTIECWVYVTDPTTVVNGMTIVGNTSHAADGYSNNVGWGLTVNRNGNDTFGARGISFYNFDESGTMNIDLKYSPMIEAHKWHHITVVRKQNNFNLFLDGKLVAQITSDASINIVKPYAYIGNNNNQFGKLYSGTAFFGYIDELRISNIARWTADFTPPGDVVVPNAPTNLIAIPGDSLVNLNWDAVTGATGYNVKRSLTAGGPYETIANASDTSYVDTNVVNGTTYYYVVTAVNADGESANSNEASGTPQAASVEDGQGLLRVTMIDSSEREYKLPMSEINAFISWFDRTVGTGTTVYMLDKLTPNSKEYLAFEKIISFEVTTLD